METRRIVPPDEPTGSGEVLAVGQVLVDRYQIQDIIGVGGMSTVYRARDLHFPNIERLVAVKEMITHAATLSAKRTSWPACAIRPSRRFSIILPLGTAPTWCWSSFKAKIWKPY